MRVSDLYAGNWLRADDLSPRGIILTIDYVEIEKVGNDEKPVLHFTDHPDDKSVTLNKTNAIELAEFLGDDMDDWHGKKIRVFRATTMFQGKRMPCIRMSAANGASEGSEDHEQEQPQGSGSGSGSGSRKPGKGRKEHPDDPSFP